MYGICVTFNLDVDLGNYDNTTYEGFIFYNIKTYVYPHASDIVSYMMGDIVLEGVIGKIIMKDSISVSIFQLFYTMVSDKTLCLVAYNSGSFNDYFLLNVLI